MVIIEKNIQSAVGTEGVEQAIDFVKTIASRFTRLVHESFALRTCGDMVTRHLSLRVRR